MSTAEDKVVGQKFNKMFFVREGGGKGKNIWMENTIKKKKKRWEMGSKNIYFVCMKVISGL